MKWTKVFYQCQTCWVSGIYKIISHREGEYMAFYIVDGYPTWGDFVSKPPDTGKFGAHCWRTLEAAQSACEAQSERHDPKASTVNRAAELFSQMEIIEHIPVDRTEQQQALF